jgi:methylaspartate ammonia-lyase
LKVKDVICAAGRSGYMHRDLAAIKVGKAKPNGSLYDGEPMSPGFTRIIEPRSSACACDSGLLLCNADGLDRLATGEDVLCFRHGCRTGIADLQTVDG